MTPNFSILRALHARIAAKPEALVSLNAWKSEPNICGTPFCVLGELVEMPEAKKLGFYWDNDEPFCEGKVAYEGPGLRQLGIDFNDSSKLFGGRMHIHISEKQEALERIEKLFADHGVELHLPDSIEYARRDEVVA